MEAISPMTRIAVAALLLAGATASAQPRPDTCQAQIPGSLANALRSAFPGYRTPLETDNAPDDIEYSRRHGGNGCLGVAIADLTGEGKKDYVVGLSAVKGSAGLAVVALPRTGGWRFQRIQSPVENARYLQYVDVAEPGRYDRKGGISTPLQAGESQSIDCPHWVARVGAVGATGVVYCYQQGRWSYVRRAE
jgi:hypothetical protein